MYRIQVSPAQLYAAAARFREAAHRVRQTARRMRNALEGTTWRGVSRTRFGDRLREWEWEAERTASALESVAESLVTAARAFEEADRRSRR
ncbi:MAG: WXG100 family type VII secretion target [Anaerolineae bacterium]|nr:WXG100 family type VII secretion target [Anaerolineae bacterium]MCX8066421.1 WXG100 family type VII secretion target [Anaerolineae bacterium]MDW7991848.1 WXG100 family type VII secretion target [Anaerolineae bacterium]